MSCKQKVVLVECGSFNPITNLHLRMFELARDHLHRHGQYEVVGGLISPVNDGYKKKDLISSKHRIELIKLALKSNDWIRLDTWEADQNIWHETAVVLNHLQSVVNSTFNESQSPKNKKAKLESNGVCETCNHCNTVNQQPIKVMLLCGADLLESFGRPGLWSDADVIEIVNKFGLVVITREGANPYKFIYESDLLTRLERTIVVVTEWIANEISSTKIRRAIRRGESVKYLLEDAVIQYIHKLRLFQNNDNKYSYGLLTPSPNADMLYPTMHEQDAVFSSQNGQLLAPPTSAGCLAPFVPTSLPIIPPPIQYRQSSSAIASVHQSDDQKSLLNHEVNHLERQISNFQTSDHETPV